MKTKREPRNRRKDVDALSTKLVQAKVTPEEYSLFHMLAWYRRVKLPEHIRALLKADLAAAEAEGMQEEMTRMRSLLAPPGKRAKPAKKRKG